MVFSKYGEALLSRVERRAFRDGEALQRAANLEAEVVVGVGGVVKVDDEAPLAGRTRAVLTFRRKRLVRPEGVPFFTVFPQGVVARTRNVRRFYRSFPGCDEALLAFGADAH